MSGKSCKPWGLNRGITRLYDCKTTQNETIDKKAIKDEFITVLKSAFDDAYENYRPLKDRRAHARTKKAAATTAVATKVKSSSKTTRATPKTLAATQKKTFATYNTGATFKGPTPSFNTRG